MKIDPNKIKFIESLPLIVHQAGKFGLWKTMHSLNDALRVAGYELADHIIKEQKPKKKK